MEFIRKLMKPLTQARLTGWVLIVLCAVLAIVSGSRWGFNRFRYRNVVQWPSVPVEIEGMSSMRGAVPIETKSGRSQISTSLNVVRFSYRVNGSVYQGDRASPDGDIPPVWTVSVNGGPLRSGIPRLLQAGPT